MYVFDEMKIIEIFCKIDDYYLSFEQWADASATETKRLGTKAFGPKGGLSPSEQMTLLVFYPLSGFKCFKYYYQRLVKGGLNSYFPQAPSYNRFVELIPRSCLLLWGLIHLEFPKNLTGTYFIDSTKLPVCDVHRIHSHKVFKKIARRGKTSTGWFFGLKLHMLINQMGQIIALRITSGNLSDNNPQLLRSLLKGLKGKCFGDKGYLSKIFDELLQNGLQLFTKIRKNMKNQLLTIQDKRMLNARTLIETVFDILKHILNIDHTRHRSPNNAITHLMAGVAAYQFLDEKPSIKKNKSAIEFIRTIK